MYLGFSGVPNQTPSPNLPGKEGYGAGMQRQEVQPGWAKGKKVVVVPVVNVEAQLGRSLGENGSKPAISWSNGDFPGHKVGM